MKILKWVLGIITIIGIGYLVGPHPNPATLKASLPPFPDDLQALNQVITYVEDQNPSIKEGNKACIVWADTASPSQTPYSLVYLHGFSASHEEGAALAKAFGARYGCNVYLSRLFDHGLQTGEAMLNLDADSLYQSAVDALAVGEKIGQKVILMSTSTGGTLSLQLAAQYPEVASLIMYSPNVALFDPSGALLTKPWGLQIARQVMGSDYREFEADEYTQQFWTSKYRIESLVELQRLIESSMLPGTFQAITQPVFMGYYYKDEAHQDKTVSVAAMLEMFDLLSTPEAQKRKVAFPEAGDHVIANPHTSKSYKEICDETFKFAEEVLQLTIKPTEEVLP